MRRRKFITALLSVASVLSFPLPFAQPALAQGLPEQAYVSGLVGHAQSYPLSCESRSAADLAAFWGSDITETQFLNALPRSDNPNVGFVGSVYGPWGYTPPHGYGVHARPVAVQLRAFGLQAKAHYGMSWDNLRAEIAAGRPVIVWVVGLVWAGTAKTYTASDGEQVTVAPYEHTMILIGYDSSYVQLVDAGSGLTVTHTVSNFLTSWAVLGNQAVTASGIDPPSPDEQGEQTGSQSTQLPPNNPTAETYLVRSGDYLTKLAPQLGTTWQLLAAFNNLTYPYIIYPGQRLTLPPGASSSPQPAVTPTPAPTSTPSPPPTPTPTPSPVDPPQSPTSSEETYTVQRGDHLMKIARQLGLDWLAIASLNDLSSPYLLYPGQLLQLPAPDVLDESQHPVPQATPQPTTQAFPETYTVQRGEYLLAIALRFGVNWQALAAVNGIQWPYIVYPGQVLDMP